MNIMSSLYEIIGVEHPITILPSSNLVQKVYKVETSELILSEPPKPYNKFRVFLYKP